MKEIKCATASKHESYEKMGPALFADMGESFSVLESRSNQPQHSCEPKSNPGQALPVFSSVSSEIQFDKDSGVKD